MCVTRSLLVCQLIQACLQYFEVVAAEVVNNDGRQLNNIIVFFTPQQSDEMWCDSEFDHLFAHLFDSCRCSAKVLDQYL